MSGQPLPAPRRAAVLVTLALLFALSFVVLASKGALAGALPIAPSDVLMLLVNAATVAVGLQLVSIGAQAVPGTEAALASLLETAVSPILVYWFVGEVPSVETRIAGVLICTTLAAHSLYDAHLEKLKLAAASDAAPRAEVNVALAETELTPLRQDGETAAAAAETSQTSSSDV
jgi:hypothetical protein